MDVTMYCPTRVKSSRTHEDTIDIEIYGVGHVRIFLSKDLAMELIHKMLTALSTPFKEEEDPTVK
jgi:hypothetical protein